MTKYTTSTQPVTKTQVACPTCGKKTAWCSTNTFRPFCSERCKLIDLGAWAGEEHRIPSKMSDVSERDLDVLIESLEGHHKIQ